MKVKKLFSQILNAAIIGSVLCFSAMNVSAATNQFRGVNWADPKDNFNTGVIYISGLSASDTYASASIVSDRVVGSFMSKLNSNSVRMPINEPTVSSYWRTYTGAIDKALSKGKVILCYWSPTHNGKPADMTKYWNMWSTVVQKYGNNSNCYFEVFNEPHMYNTTDLCNLYYSWITKYPSVPNNRVILDGTGMAQGVSAVGRDSRLSSCLLAVHDYTMFAGTSMNENDWAKHISSYVGNYANRTICTEWGAPMSPGTKNGVNYGTQNYNSTGGSYFVPYLRGISNQLHNWNMGSFYWAGLKDGDWYSITKKNGSGSGISLSVSNQSGLDCLQYAWGIKTPGTTTYKLSDGWYSIKNVNAQKYLQVANNIGKAAQNVEIGTGTGADGQKWYLTNLADGYVTLKSALGEYMLDVNNAANTNGANIQIYNAYSNNAQKYSIKSSLTNGAYSIATMVSNQTKVLDDANSGTSDGTNVCQWTYGGRNNQLWVFESVK